MFKVDQKRRRIVLETKTLLKLNYKSYIFNRKGGERVKNKYGAKLTLYLFLHYFSILPISCRNSTYCMQQNKY